jgi:hypothetical protein
MKLKLTQISYERVELSWVIRTLNVITLQISQIKINLNDILFWAFGHLLLKNNLFCENFGPWAFGF